MRGGVSGSVLFRGADNGSSPRAWGCFCLTLTSRQEKPVFPTCVGVFPQPRRRGPAHLCLPHVRGGVSDPLWGAAFRDASSPRAWGCFCGVLDAARFQSVFPTCVGVFPVWRTTITVSLSLPHVRGGVSCCIGVSFPLVASSPRAWGCFFLEQYGYETMAVFPTCVGVFPLQVKAPCPIGSLPHVRGGVSQYRLSTAGCPPSSPRAWGCFQAPRLRLCSYRVFPTCVGVFLKKVAPFRTISGLPHVRGGVSILK